MHSLRTRIKKEIICEFLPPARALRRQKVIILCDGMPSVPKKTALLEFFSKKGYWIFHPRYRGSWESGGSFLAKSPEQDVLDVIDDISQGFTSIPASAKQKPATYRLRPDALFVIGGSFGGPAAILTSRDPRVNKAIAVCPIVDWKKIGRAEPLTWLKTHVRTAFGNGYRYTDAHWDKLGNSSFYNPVSHESSIDGSKLLIIHAKDDDTAPYSATNAFARRTKTNFISLARGGHISTQIILENRIYKKISAFLKS